MPALPVTRVNALRRVVLLAVAIALVGTQAIGLHHRVEHGATIGWVDPGAIDALASTPSTTDAHIVGAAPATTDHHCAAIDALALGDGPPASSLPAVVIAASARAVTAPANPLLLSARRQPFQARAPPALLS